MGVGCVGVWHHLFVKLRKLKEGGVLKPTAFHLSEFKAASAALSRGHLFVCRAPIKRTTSAIAVSNLLTLSCIVTLISQGTYTVGVV